MVVRSYEDSPLCWFFRDDFGVSNRGVPMNLISKPVTFSGRESLPISCSPIISYLQNPTYDLRLSSKKCRDFYEIQLLKIPLPTQD